MMMFLRRPLSLLSSSGLRRQRRQRGGERHGFRGGGKKKRASSFATLTTSTNDTNKEESSIFQSRLHSPKPTRLSHIQSAYVHLPFCKQKCHYCDFATQIIGDRRIGRDGGKINDAMDAYTDFVCREITHQGRLRGTYEKTSSRGGREKNEKGLETIFFGGGTPSLMSVKQMEKLLVSLENAFGIDWSQVEISMECDPGTFTRRR